MLVTVIPMLNIAQGKFDERLGDEGADILACGVAADVWDPLLQATRPEERWTPRPSE
jgi:hypothetical protein